MAWENVNPKEIAQSLSGAYRSETLIFLGLFAGLSLLFGPVFLERFGVALWLMTAPIGVALIVLSLIAGLLYALGVGPRWVAKWRPRGVVMDRFAFHGESGKAFVVDPPGQGWRCYVRVRFDDGRTAELHVPGYLHRKMGVGTRWDFRTISRRTEEARRTT